MEADVYTVPSEVVFKNYSTSTGPQTRNLLIKNTTSKALQTVISYPFSPSFRLSAPADLRADLKPKPPHLILELPPKSTSKVIVELRPPSSTAANGPQFLHDSLVVLAGSVCVLRVPVRAVPGAEPAAAPTVTPFWPPQKEIDAHCDSFISQVKSMYDVLTAPRPDAAAAVAAPLQPPLQPPPAAAASALAPPATAFRAPMPVGSEVADSSGAVSGAVRPSSVGVSGTSPAAAAPTLLRSDSGSAAEVLPPGATAAAVIPAAAAAASRPTAELPPEGFSQPRDMYDDAGDVLYDNYGDVVQQPFVLHKTVKVQGRVAVAVPVDGDSGAGMLSLPQGNSLSRTNSTSSLTAAAGGLAGNGSRPGSASGGKLAFSLNGKLYDARGNLLDPSLEQLSPVGGLMVVDCGEGGQPPSPSPPQQQQQQTIRTSSSGTSLTSLTPPWLSAPPIGGGGGSGGSTAGLSPGPASSRVSLAPLKYGNLPVTASLRPGSATSSMSPHLGRPPPPPPAYTGSAGPGAAVAAAAAPSSAGGSDDDPLRKAALAAALRDLGITDLPMPSPRRPPSSGQVPTGPDGLRQVAGAGTLLSGLSPPSYLQYGLPPNYRPSSGRRRPPSATGSTAAYDSGGDEDAYDHDDADLEAKLVQQIETNVLKAAGPAAAPAPRRTVGPCAAASPGSYLPPRAGAASTGGLGAKSAAAANAAAVAAGSRLGKAAAAAAAAAGGTAAAARRTMGQSSSGGDTDYPEESEFEVQLQRQIDTDVANGGGVTAGGGGGGGASWRGSSGSRGAATPRLAGQAGPASGSGATGVPKRASSSSGTSAAAAVAATGGVRRASADAATASATASDKGATRGSAAATRSGSGAGPRQQTGGGAGNAAAGPRPVAPKPAAAAGTALKPAAGASASKSKAGKAPAAAAVAAGAAPVAAAAAGGGGGGAGLQRMKANWDALG